MFSPQVRVTTPDPNPRKPISVASLPQGPRTSRTRRTRFVCISDTHNNTPKLPKGDVLIHAGDLTNQGTYSELSKAVSWLAKQPFEIKIVVAGNHDLTLDEEFYSRQGANLHQTPQNPEACRRLLSENPGITYLNHAGATVRLASPSGPRTIFTVFGSPYSPCQDTGTWAFQYPRDSDEATRLWSLIPLDTDLLITHTPPYHHCDESISKRKAMGCEILRKAMWRVRPKLHVCGHVHEGRGAERVKWDISSGNVAYAERGSEIWEDQSGNGRKMSLVDLTAKTGKVLDNDGCHPAEVSHGADDGLHDHTEDDDGQAEVSPHHNQPSSSAYRLSRINQTRTDGPSLPGYATHSLGEAPIRNRSQARSDTEALRGRTGRRETCVVNCAIAATSYPHIGGKRYNKPIVIDIDLPVWTLD
ncbi:hypothetical protein DL546_002203 [Coniochaeta pulveracea]|uniref:Calcineurin-like phosphoesterase domain-containing protein n=1 Tax=Coniochaeta pulveracea TaxID=177199 RepID=A0A420Y222_9PEZI|nr:hypothetical protein DL546_002203 [Coniochaeta pulveracea]